jgi:biopolymer transport protein ExbD
MENNIRHKIIESSLKPKLSLDITPLIDIVFLLVAFFLLTSSLGKEQSIHVDLPKAFQSKESPGKDLTLSIQADGSVYLDRKLMKKEDYKKEIISFIKATGKQNIKNVVIRGDKGSPYEVVIGIMDTLSAEGLDNFALAISKE